MPPGRGSWADTFPLLLMPGLPLVAPDQPAMVAGMRDCGALFSLDLAGLGGVRFGWVEVKLQQ